MPGIPLRAVLNHLRRTVASADDALADGQLLDAYVQRLDEDAFAELLRRHGPMVLGVCRRVLGDLHRAEDAFQATFLVLVRKSGSVVCETTLAGWLYRTALNTAMHARADHHRRRETTEVVDMPDRQRESSDEAPGWLELQPVLDEELRRLPERLRLVLVLCGLEGRSREEAGRLLGISEGAVKGRLERGRERLRQRLKHRGFALPAAAFAMLLTTSAAPAVPAALAASALTMTRSALMGQAIASQSVSIARIVEGVLRTMLMNRIQFVAVALASLLLLLGGSVVVGHWLSDAVSAPLPAPPEETTLFEGEHRVVNVAASGKIVFAPDGRRVAFLADGKIQIWDTTALVRGDAPLKTISLPDAAPVSISPDGKLLAVSYKEGLKVLLIDDKEARIIPAATEKALENTAFGGWSDDSRELFVVRRKLAAKQINLDDGKSIDVATQAELEKACRSKIEFLEIRAVHGSGAEARVFMVGTRHVTGEEVRKRLKLPAGMIGVGPAPEDHQWCFLKAGSKLTVSDDNADRTYHANKDLSQFFCFGFKSEWLPPAMQTKRSTLEQFGTADATLKPRMSKKVSSPLARELEDRTFHHLGTNDNASRAQELLMSSRLVSIRVEGPDQQKKLEARFAGREFIVPLSRNFPKEFRVQSPVWSLYSFDADRNEVKSVSKVFGEKIDDLNDPGVVRIDGSYDNFGWSKAAGVVAVSLKSKLLLMKVPEWER